MKLSQTFAKTKREVGEEAESINHQLLIKGGYINQLMAGVYSYLPLGYRVIRKIENIVRDEMVRAGGEEILMPVIQPKENWQKTGRWESLDVLYHFVSPATKTELALGPTHEEVVVPLAKQFIQSYKDLPKAVFQIQTKFRDEKRAKSGILRGREFIMKDLYSFHTSEEDLDRYYEIMKQAYLNVYQKMGIGNKTYLTFASGGSFSKYSHEFQTETPAGEDIIYLCPRCKVAINREIIEEQNACPQCQNGKLEEIKAIEVGNIFKLKTKYSEPFDLTFMDAEGNPQLVSMGCYGIGISRLMGTVVEACHDSKGIVWPKEIAPYQVHLISIGAEGYREAERLYAELTRKGFEILWDDRNETAGVKFADADLIGIPVRLVVSDKLVQNDSVELKERTSDAIEIIKTDELENALKIRLV